MRSTDGDPLPAQLAPLAEAAPERPRAFAEALRFDRVREGLAQDEVAELMKVTPQAVGAWELGVNVPIQMHYDLLVLLFPELAKTPPPPSRDIDKPSGGPGSVRGVPDRKEPQMSMKPVSVRQPVTEPRPSVAAIIGAISSTPLPPKPDKATLIAWTKCLRALEDAESTDYVIKMLVMARESGMTVPELLELLEGW